MFESRHKLLLQADLPKEQLTLTGDLCTAAATSIGGAARLHLAADLLTDTLELKADQAAQWDADRRFLVGVLKSMEQQLRRVCKGDLHAEAGVFAALAESEARLVTALLVDLDDARCW